MRLLRMKKIHEGSYLNNYELTYLNKGGRENKVLFQHSPVHLLIG